MAPTKYWEWIKVEALKINSDGCTMALECGKKCCWEHDLAFYYGRDPRHAFLCQDWTLADPIGFMETNNRFAGCLPWWLKYRWVAVTVGGKRLWDYHRSRRP